MYSLMLSVVMAVIGVVLWIEGGPHPRTRAAWLAAGGDPDRRRSAVTALPAVLLDSCRVALTMIPVRWSHPGWTTSAPPVPARFRRDLNGIYGVLAGCFSTSDTIASMSTCPWVIQSVRALNTRRTMSRTVRTSAVSSIFPLLRDSAMLAIFALDGPTDLGGRARASMIDERLVFDAPSKSGVQRVE